MDVSVFRIPAFADISSLTKWHRLLVSTFRAPFCGRNPLVKDDSLRQEFKLRFDSAETSMSNLFAKMPFLPVAKLFILHHYARILLEFMNHFVCLVFFLV